MPKSILLFVLLVSCVHSNKPASYPVPQSKDDCMQLFHDISETQSVRREAMNKMSQATSAFESGKMSRNRFQKKREDWLELEGRFRSYVTFLYDIGYEHGCF